MSQSTLQLVLLIIAALLFLLEALNVRGRFGQAPAGTAPGYYGAALGWFGLCLLAVALLVPLVGK